MTLAVLLRCQDLCATRRFYEQVLGFDARDTAEGTLTAALGGARLIFTEQDLWDGAVGCSGTFYFTVADVDGYFGRVRDRVQLAWPLQDMPYGSREFGIRDCNGYGLAFQAAA